MAGLWNKMSQEGAQGANRGAFGGKIEEHPAADARGNDMRVLHGGAACWEHTGFPQLLVESIKTVRALIFGGVKPSGWMANSITR